MGSGYALRTELYNKSTYLRKNVDFLNHSSYNIITKCISYQKVLIPYICKHPIQQPKVIQKVYPI